MATSKTTIQALNDTAQKAAVEGFAKFYFQRYFGDGLDVFAQLDQVGNVTDLNQYLFDNRSLTHQDLIKGLFAQRPANLMGLLEATKMTFNGQGAPDQPWEQWYQAHVDQLPQGL